MCALPEYLSSLYMQEAVLRGKQSETSWSFILLDEWESSSKWNSGKYCIIQSLSGEEKATECRRAFSVERLQRLSWSAKKGTAVPDVQQHKCNEIQNSVQVGWFPTLHSAEMFPSSPAHMCICVGTLHKGHAYPGSPEGTLNDCVRYWWRTVEYPKAAFLW